MMVEAIPVMARERSISAPSLVPIVSGFESLSICWNKRLLRSIKVLLSVATYLLSSKGINPLDTAKAVIRRSLLRILQLAVTILAAASLLRSPSNRISC